MNEQRPPHTTPTIRDVALRSGVSPMTVSRVVNGSARVRPATRERVEAAIAALGYVPNHLARGLTRQKTSAIGLIVPDFADPFFTLILRGAEDVARRAGFRVILCNTDGDVDREDAYLEDMVAHRVAGLLIAPVSDRSRGNLRRLGQHRVPFVLIDRSIPGVETDVVQGDSIDGARQLTAHLIARGHRRIAHITEPREVSTARDRLRGYRDALTDAGIPFDPQLVVEAKSATRAGGYDATRALLSRAVAPTAIFAVNNLAAVGAVMAIREQGLEIPDDLAVVCFDDIELAAILCPFLTVMAQPAETFGTLGAQLLLDRIAGRTPERRRRVVLPADLIIRVSSGADPELIA
ncbi:MAG: LacI family DNA-binding transcriptional regulator [Thermomicrobiales bacterium]